MSNPLSTQLHKATSMQSKEKDSIDARSFPEIWATLSLNERDELVYSLIRNKCCTTRQAIYYWASGKKAPRNLLLRDTVAKAVGKVTGSRIVASTLFPR